MGLIGRVWSPTKDRRNRLFTCCNLLTGNGKLIYRSNSCQGRLTAMQAIMPKAGNGSNCGFGMVGVWFFCGDCTMWFPVRITLLPVAAMSERAYEWSGSWVVDCAFDCGDASGGRFLSMRRAIRGLRLLRGFPAFRRWGRRRRSCFRRCDGNPRVLQFPARVIF